MPGAVRKEDARLVAAAAAVVTVWAVAREVAKVVELYDGQMKRILDLMMDKNHDYGEAWRQMRISSMVDLILMKLLRIKQIEDNEGKTLVSEGVEGGYMDIVNYSLFCLVRLTEEENSKS